MEAVQSFNQEMTSLYEVKPPISKASFMLNAVLRINIMKMRFGTGSDPLEKLGTDSYDQILDHEKNFFVNFDFITIKS